MIRHTRSRAAVLSAAAASLVLVLAGCGDEESPESGPGGSEDLTAPGTTLQVGQTATVTRGGPDQVLEVTITGIQDGEPADLEGADRSTAPGTDPVYVSYELTHVSGDSPYLPIDDFLSGWSGDSQVAMLAIQGDFQRCHEETFGQDAPEGTTVSGCATFVTEPGSPLDRVQYGYGDDYDAFEGDQVSWER